jgi:hypothetical protein
MPNTIHLSSCHVSKKGGLFSYSKFDGSSMGFVSDLTFGEGLEGSEGFQGVLKVWQNGASLIV